MSEPQKPVKKKGPIRFEAIVPFAIIVGLIVAYFVLFFDLHLRKGLEWAAMHVNGAEVNIGSLKTSFINASMDIGKVEVTHPKEPARNRFEVGKIGFKALWDGLLRAKVVVDYAGVTGIEVNTQRKSPGRVLPPPSEGGGPGLGSKMVALAKDQLSKSSLGDVAKFLEGADPTAGLKDLGNLKSSKYAEQLKAELAKKEAEWKSKLDAIPGDKDFAALQARINALSANVSPAEAPARINEAKGLISEVQTKVGSVTSLGTALNGDVSDFGGAVGKIDDMARADREELEGKLKLPSLDSKSIAEQLFGGLVLDKVGRVDQYVQQARAYMPAKKKDEAAPKPAPRAEGRIYEFPTTGSYPRYWLKHAEISSEGGNSAFGGDVRGQMLDASSNQALTGKPMVFDLAGDFAQQQIRNVLAKITVDHRTENPVESLKASIGSYPVPTQNFSESGAVKFGIGKASGATALVASLRGDEFTLESKNDFSNVDYQIAAENKLLESTLKSVVSELPVFNVSAKVWGTLTAPKISISSNLATAIERGFAKQLQAKLAEARQKLDNMIQAKVGPAKKQVTDRYEQTRAQITGQVDARKKQAEAVHAQAEAKLKEIQSKATGGGLDKIKKKLPFGK